MADKDTTRGVIGGAAALALTPHASRRLLGYHVVRHGTTNENAAKIKQKGLDPRKGGIGGAGDHAAGTAERAARFKAQSSGKVHVTKNPIISRVFASMTEKRTNKPTTADLTAGKVVKARVSHRHWENMKKDPHMGGGKWVAATSRHKIPAHQVIGGAGDKGVRGVVNKNTLRGYYQNAKNHNRITRGAVMAAGAVSGAYEAAKAIKHKLEKKASLTELARAHLEA